MDFPMQLITYLFLVSSGLLFGFVIAYSLWYRDRTGDETLRRKLTRENEDLRTSLKLAHNSHSKLDERYNRQQGQLNVLQQLCDDWSQGREQAERDRAELEAQLAVVNSRLDDASGELTATRQQRIELEDELHRVNQEHLRSLNEVDEKHRKQVNLLETTSSQQAAQLDTAVNDRERLSEQLTLAQGEIAALKSDLTSQQQLLETAKQNADGLELEYVTLDSALADTNEQLKASRSECAEALATQKQAEEALGSLSQEHDQLKSENEQLKSRLTEFGAIDQQRAALQQALDNSNEKLKLVVEQRDQALEEETGAKFVIRGLNQRLENQEATIHRIRAQHEKTREQLTSELKQRNELETKLEAVSDELEAYIQENESLATNHTQTISSLTNQRDQFADELETTRSELADMIASHTDAIKQLTAQRDQFADTVKTREAEMAAVMASHQERIDSLVCEGDQRQAEHLEVCQRSEELVLQCAELTELCQELEDKLVVQDGESTQLTEACRDLEAKLENREQHANHLEDANASLQKQLAELRRVGDLLRAERDELLQERTELQARQQLIDQQHSDLSQSLDASKSEWTSRIETLEDQRNAPVKRIGRKPRSIRRIEPQDG